MTIDTMHALFLHDLAAIYDAELQLVDVLPRLAAETSPSDASAAFASHAQETEFQAENLRRCFRLLDAEPMTVTNQAVRGLATDHDAFLAKNPSRDALLAFDLGAAAKTEHLEIASYIGLLRQAHTLGLSEVALLLADNLRQEQTTARNVERLADELAREQMYAAGAVVEEFRWSSYTETEVTVPLAQDGTQSALNTASEANRRRDHQMSPMVNPSGKGSSTSST